jgi:nitrogen-specific signal transduction histidine kinase/CheY-like chemotaxis protein
MTVSPIRDPAGQIVGVSHISRDITERRQLEEQLRQTQKLESLGVLAGGIAHDFNNLLTGIIGNASFAMGEIPDGHPARKAVGQVLAAGDRAALLIRQMLAYAGKGRFATSRLNLSEQVSQILPLIDTSLGREVRIDLHLSQDLPLIEADASQIQQVIMNLTINGSEAIGDTPGLLTLSTFARESDSEQQVILEVRDTGCGMDEATSARIFDPFFTTKFTGRGLGLSAVLGIIRGHHGYISVESVPGYGSTFTVALPAAQASETGSLQVRGYGHLLVVDDEEVVRNLARFTLERSGYTVETAPDGTSALARLSAPSAVFDAVLLDLLMPGPSGEEIARMLLDASPGTRIVLCSSLSDSEAQTRFEGIGIAAFLQKPYTAAALTRKVKLALKRNVASAP